jgi:hypothetical protein
MGSSASDRTGVVKLRRRSVPTAAGLQLHIAEPPVVLFALYRFHVLNTAGASARHLIAHFLVFDGDGRRDSGSTDARNHEYRL